MYMHLWPNTVPDSDEEKYAEFAVRCSNESGTMSYRNACDYVLNCREVICPNEAFATQLAELEESLRNGISTFTKCKTWEKNGITPTRCYEYRKEK